MRLAPLPLLFLAGCPYIGEKEWVERVQDRDGDGVISELFGGRDCLDDDASVSDCDSDRDGVRTVRAGGEDCDDRDASVFPGAFEICDGYDQDCDGLVDEVEDVETPPTWAADDDGDGFGDPDTTVAACLAPDGFVAMELARDCDDADADVNPQAPEYCDAFDWNCDGDPVGGAVDLVQWYVDGDGDGFVAGDATPDVLACEAPPGTARMPVDAADLDCDDSKRQVFPGQAETWYDGVDADCAGDDDFDQDGDGASLVEDCDDADGDRFPGATEVCDLVDNDCDGLVDDEDDGIDDPANRTLRYVDGDGDGFGDVASGRLFCLAATPAGYVARGDDCQDGYASAYPGGTELCDGLDNDCNGAVDDNASDRVVRWQDADGDGFGAAGAPVLACSGTPNTVTNDDDCDDADAATWPGALEVCGDNVRQDCSTLSPFDCDGDGYDAVADGGTDCDDGDDDVNPGAREICDGLDNDCDTRFDDQDPNVDLSTIADWYVDADGDGFGDPARLTIAQACAPRPGEAPNGDDCDDAHATANPESREACDGFDNDCDGLVDDADTDRPVDPPTYWLDLDGDTFGDPAHPSSVTCAAPGPEWVDDDLDCQPGLAAINPFALEICDGLDNNCDGLLDDADPAAALTQWFADLDGDGYGQSTDAVAACSQPAGRVTTGGDCDDFDAARNPGATEVCDAGFDNDCDGLADDEDPDLAGLVSWWPDLDGDGYGDGAAVPLLQCGDLPGYVNNGRDCDDLSATRSPAALELCNGLDDDCDTLVDDTDDSLANAPLWYADVDVDGWGSETDTLRSCALPPGYRAFSGDCDDADDTVFPNADEVCDGRDDDCDGLVDDADADVVADLWFADVDSDGFGDGVTGAGCGPAPLGETKVGGDCDDNDGAVNPTALETCGGKDEDCDGLVDDADPSVDRAGALIYQDDDGDGYGDPAKTLSACQVLPGYAANGNDCAPVDAARNPGALEACNGVDDDCDGTTDVVPDVGPITYVDADGDGFGAASSALVECSASPGRTILGGDCDDGNPAIAPFEGEACDGIDNDCDGLVDDADPDAASLVWYEDLDGDGWGGVLPVGFGCSTLPNWKPDGGDCDQGNPAVHPGQAETCNTIDDDCDGLVDDADGDASRPEWFADGDGDGVGSTPLGPSCTQPFGSAATGGDCDDTRIAVRPGALEVCDGRDDDCDGLDDVTDPDTQFTLGLDRRYGDGDGDGFVDAGGVDGCGRGQGFQPFPGDDCNDTNAAINRVASEVCDGVDNDCDTLVDDADASRTGGTLIVYRDADLDGFGNAGASSLFCSAPGSGWTTNTTDCDDGNSGVNPSAPERCGGGDEDCDGLVDDADTSPIGAQTVLVDGDGDGWGSTSAQRCQLGTGFTSPSQGGDCDDVDGLVHPTAIEVCDGVDNDCDGFTDDGDPSRVGGAVTRNRDADFDGYGDPAQSATFCAAPGAGWAADATDCDDTRSLTNPGAAEVCGGGDEDCDGLVDDADDAPNPPNGRTSYLRDDDGDGSGGPVVSQRCAIAPGLVAFSAGGDCADSDPSVRPGAAELCDGRDNDCDGAPDDLDVDSPHVGAAFFDDSDNDGFGAGDAKWCLGGPGRSPNGDDCLDADARIYPGQAVTVPSFLPPLTTVQQAIDTVCDDADITVLIASEPATIDTRGKTLRLHGVSATRRGKIESAANPILLLDDPGVTLEDLDLVATGTNRVLQVVGVTTELTGLSLRDGTAPSGAGLDALNAQILAVDVEFVRNTAVGGPGGGAHVDGGLFTCLGCTFDGNTGNTAGALRLVGAIGWVADSTFRDDLGAAAVELQSGNPSMPYVFEDNRFEHEDGLQVLDTSAELRGLSFLDGGNVAIQVSGAQVVTLEDSDFIDSGGFGSATVVLDGSGTITVEGNRFLRSRGGDMSSTSSSHTIRNNTFVDPIDTMIHVAAQTPVIRSNLFFSLGATTVGVAGGNGAGVQFNVFNDFVPFGVAPVNNPVITNGILFQTYHPNLPPWLWDLHLPFSAAQIDLGDPAGGGVLDPNGADAGAYGGATFFDPYYVDLDADGMGDNWELRWFGTTLVVPTSDDDADGAVLADEFLFGTIPDDADTDDDGCLDGFDGVPLDPFLCGL